jgi:hypothetical protein
MDARAPIGQKSRVATEVKILKLSDEFGQYTLVLQCSACGHERHAQPHALARLCGWDTYRRGDSSPALLEMRQETMHLAHLSAKQAPGSFVLAAVVDSSP